MEELDKAIKITARCAKLVIQLSSSQHHCDDISIPGLFLCMYHSDIKPGPNFSQNFCGHKADMKRCETVQFTVHHSAEYCIESLFSLVDISKTSQVQKPLMSVFMWGHMAP